VRQSGRGSGAFLDEAIRDTVLIVARQLHMGDVGNPVAPGVLETLAGEVDVLLALAGAHATIALDDLDRAIAAIAPRIVVPMHCWHPRGVLKIEPVARFLQRHPKQMISRRTGPSLTIDPDHLPATCQIIVLDQAR